MDEARCELRAAVEVLRRRIRRLHAIVVMAGAGLVCAAAWPQQPAQGEHGSDRVLRVRGLIIEDDKGRERILLGAPIPQVAGRTRKDTATALVFVGENGADRVALGFMPDPQVKGKLHKRLSPSVGLQINDAAGNERAGFGNMDIGRTNLGIDWPGREAIVLSVDDASGLAIMQMWGEKEGTAERAGFALTRDGMTLMKVADETGFERFVMQTKGTQSVSLLLGDPSKGEFVDVLPKLRDE
jgi:hypothetical protein